MKRAVLLMSALLCLAQANAASQFGVEVYPAAKADAAVAKSLNKHMNMKNVATYRTSDSVSKVAEFYKKRPLKEQPGTSKEGAMFSGKGVAVTIQNPWMDMGSGEIMSDTLISIVTNRLLRSAMVPVENPLVFGFGSDRSKETSGSALAVTQLNIKDPGR